MKKVIIIHHEPLTIKIKRNFYINDLLSNHIEVEYWDISPMLYGDFSLVDQLVETYCKSFKTIEELESCIILNKESVFITEYAHTIDTLFIDNLLFKNKCITSEIGIHTAINISLKEKIVNLRSYGFKISTIILKVYKKFKYLLLKLLYKVKSNPDIAFYCGSESKKHFTGVQCVVPINSFDYEDNISLNENMDNNYNENSYIVFIDQYYPYHPDMYAYGAYKMDDKKYFANLNRVFSLIENKYNRKVIILGHPKSNYPKDLFLGREIIKYRTAELVKKSYMVLCHDSMAISFAVLNYKPILFLYTEDFYHLGISTMILISKFSKLLKRPCVNIDNVCPTDFDNIISVNRTLYDRYKYMYLTTKESEDSINSVIIPDALKSYINE